MRMRVLLTLLVGMLLWGDATTAQDRPNILFIYLDDLGWRDTGFMGSDFYETPHLDRLAAEGMIFTSAYSCAANCAPARASLLSGQYTPRHRVFNVGTRPRGKAKYRRLEHVQGTDTLDPKMRTWAHHLQDAGYATALIGKWHLSDDPCAYGFDLNVGGTKSGSPPGGYYPPHVGAPGLKHAPGNEYLTDRLTGEAIDFVRAQRDQAWMVYLSHFAVHTPLDAKQQLVQKYRQKPAGKLHHHVAMATMIQAVDDGVGRLRQELEELGLLKKTAIIFCSDNGGFGPATDMAPLKGYKGTYYEGGIRIPFFVRWPEVVASGTRSDEPITGVDLYPTLCAIAGIRLPPEQTLDGESLLPLFQGRQRSGPTRALFWHFPCYLQSYAVWGEQRDPLFRTRPCSVVRVGDWKLHEFFEDGAVELYNLREDIGETTDLQSRFPAKRDELLDRLRGWRQELDAPVPRKENSKYDAAAEAAAILKKRQR